MTPRRKGARFLIHPMFARQLAYQLSRNKVAKLMQYTQLVRGWFCPFGFSSFLSFHRWFLNRNHRLTTRPTFFFCYLWDVIVSNFKKIESSPSRLAADGVSDSFAIWTEITYALLEVDTNVPGGAVPPLASLLRVDRALRAR